MAGEAFGWFVAQTGTVSGKGRFVQESVGVQADVAESMLVTEAILPPASLTRSTSGLAIFTICSNNYLGMARILISSAKAFHPDATIYLCLVDRIAPDRSIYPGECTIVPVEDLPIPNIRAFLFRYDVMEVNTAVKPFMFQHLIGLGHADVIYFDPDIQLFAPLDGVLAHLHEGASFTLTPHLCHPAEDEDFPDDLGVMRAGVYNLGFLGVHACEESERILAWWARRLEYYCLSEQTAGIFVDQKFMDLLPGFTAQASILRDPALNVGYWNLVQRRLGFEDGGLAGGRWTIDGQPLLFYHFSGFSPARPDQLSKHTKAFRGDAISPALARLLRQYAQQLDANGHGHIPAGLYAFGRFASGNRIPMLVRTMFRERHKFWSGDPFATYEAYVQSPMAGQWSGSASAIVTNLMGYLHSQQPGLQAHFDLQTEPGVRGYAEWFVQHGEEYLEHSG